MDGTLVVLLVACGATAVFAIVFFLLREAWLARRSRGLEKRAQFLQELLNDGGGEAQGFASLRKRHSTLRDLEALEKLLEERRRRLTPDTPQEQVVALFESYDRLGIVDRYVRQLEKSRRWTERAFAARFLGEIGSARAVPALIRVLRNTREEDRDVRLAAGRALGRICDPRALPSLLEALDAPESWLPARVAEVILQFKDTAFEPVVALLERQDSQIGRAWAAEILGDLGNPKAVPFLMNSIRDLNDQVRGRSASALGKLECKGAVTELIQIMLGDPVPFVRIQAVRALGEIGDPRAMHHLIDALKDGEWWVRIRVVEALEQLGDQAVEPLYLALEDHDAEVRSRAAMTLERLGVLDELLDRVAELDISAREKLLAVGQAGVIEVLIGALHHSDVRVRYMVTELLGEIRNPAILPALLRLLEEEEDPTVRAGTVRSLSLLQDQSVAEPISRLLGDPDETLRIEAVHALERIQVKEPHSLLATAVQDPESRVRSGAAIVLGKVGDEHSIPALLVLLGDADASVRTESARALGLLHADAAVPRLLEVFHDYDTGVQIAAARSLGQIGSQDCLDVLVRGLEAASPDLGEAISWALGQIRWDNPERLIDVLFQGSDRSSRLGALATLGQVGQEAGRELIRSMLRDADPEVVGEAVRILGELRDREAVADLVALLQSPAESTRQRVLEALCHIQDPEALPAVRIALSDPSPSVRASAVLALGFLRDHESADLLCETLRSERSTPEMRAHALLGLMVIDRDRDLPMILEALQNIPLYDFLHEKNRLSNPILRETVEAVKMHSMEFMVASVRSRPKLEQTLIHELSTSHDVQKRMRAIRILAHLESKGAYTAVWGRFHKDPSQEVRVVALQFLADLAPEDELFRLLMDGLNDLHSRVRVESLRRMRSIPVEQALPQIVPHLDAEEPELQEVLVDYLVDLPASDLEGFLDGILGAELGLRGRLLIVRVLGRAHSQHTALLLEAFLLGDEPELRRAVAQNLTQVPVSHARELLLSCGQDPDVGVRRAALDAAAQLGGTVGLELLEAAFGEPAAELRRLALLHVARLAPGQMQADLRALARDTDPSVRAAALAGLVVNGSEPVEEWIAPRDLRRVSDTLREVSTPEASERTLVQSRSVEERVAALKVLFFLGGRRRGRALATARQDPAEPVQALAESLEHILGRWLADPEASTWLEEGPGESSEGTMGTDTPVSAAPRG